MKKLRTIAGRQVRDLVRNLERVGQLGVYERPLRLLSRIAKQGRRDKEQIASLYSREESGISKGKVQKYR
ncbi:MAG: hypothetical protein AAF392_02080 [Bacteroidota bacterium]